MQINIHDQQKSNHIYCSCQSDFAYTYTLRDGANPPTGGDSM